ncbi:hypothetical protein ACSX1A_04170 [Pontibacter sp. MBLB2868]|uniref:hypothetical protein n=1 Tax=Pontibacter sp. MBLB2868 TaxID=3451555 RepID=UPI003F74C4D6
MIKRLIPLQLLLLLLLSSCGTPDSLKNFDSATWKEDRYGCKGERQKLVGELENVRSGLYGKKEYVVRNVLGKPDSETLLERSQRIYYYYIEPGTQCTERGKLSEANRVEVHINPTGKVSEVSFAEPIQTKKPE